MTQQEKVSRRFEQVKLKSSANGPPELSNQEEGVGSGHSGSDQGVNDIMQSRGHKFGGLSPQAMFQTQNSMGGSNKPFETSNWSRDETNVI